MLIIMLIGSCCYICYGDKLRAWIEHCIDTVRFSILINVSPYEFFSISRGLRQKIHYRHYCL
jgi:hypothetical protein